MKRKMFLIVISVLVLCLTCGMLFVACNDKNEGNDDGGKNPGEIDIPDTAADILTEVVKNFGEVKADTTGAKEFNLGLDITDADNKPVFSLVFETIDGDDFIYGSVGDGAMTKFNGLDLGGTVETVLSWFGSGLSISGTQIPFDAEQFVASGLIETITGFNVIGNFAKSSDGNSYSLQLNLSTIAGLLSGFEKTINDWIANSGYADIINTVIDAVYGLIVPDEATTSTEGGPDDASPATVTELVEVIADNYTLTFYFGFEDNTGKDAAAEKAAQPFGDLALSSKVMAARQADARNLLNFTVDATVYGYEKTVTPATEEGGEDVVTVSEDPNKKYTISIGADINIFEIFAPILDCVTTGPDKNGNMMPNGFAMSDEQLATLMTAIENLGYINITINEVNVEDDSLVKNLITIHSDFSEGMAIAAINLPDLDIAGLITANLQIGGVYDFDGIVAVVKGLIANAAEEEPAAESAALDLGGIDIMSILKSVLACVDFSNMAENGITIQVDTLVDTLINTLLGADSDLGPTVETAIMDLMGSDVLNITATAGFGTCTDENKVVTDDIKSWLGIYTATEDGGTYAPAEGAIDNIVEVTGMGKNSAFPADGNEEDGIIKYPEGQLFGFQPESGRQEKFIELIGKNKKGETVNFYGYIVGTSMPGGLYPEAGTYENPTFYIGLGNDLAVTIGTLKTFLGFDIPITWPVSGIIPFQYEGTIEIVELSDSAVIEDSVNEEVYTENLKIGSQAYSSFLGNGSRICTISITDAENALTWSKTYKPSAPIVLDAEGNDVTATAISATGSFIKQYKWAQAGEFTIVVNAGSLTYEFHVTVAEA